MEPHHGQYHGQWDLASARCRGRDAASLGLARGDRINRYQVRLRDRAVRRLHRPYQRPSGSLMRHADQHPRRCRDHHHRGALTRQPASGATGPAHRRGAAVRLLPVRPGHARPHGPLSPPTQLRDAAAAPNEPTAAAPATPSTEETMSQQVGARGNDCDQHQFLECLRCNLIAHMLSDVHAEHDWQRRSR